MDSSVAKSLAAVAFSVRFFTSVHAAVAASSASAAVKMIQLVATRAIRASKVARPIGNARRR